MDDNQEQAVIDAQGRLIQERGYYIMYNPVTGNYRAETAFVNANAARTNGRTVQLSTPISNEQMTKMIESAKPLLHPVGIAMPGVREDGRGSSAQPKQTQYDVINEAIDGISGEIDKIDRAIQQYSINKDKKQDDINKSLTELEQLYIRLQELPEDGFSEEFRIKVTDMKVKILQQMQQVEKMIPEMSASDRPVAAKALQGDYTDDQLRMFVAASDVLRSYNQIQDVYFDQLTLEQQTQIVNFIRDVVNPLLETKIGKERFAKEVLTLDSLCQDLIAQIVGNKDNQMNLPANELQQKLLADTLIRVTTEVRPIGDSIQLTLESTRPKDVGHAVLTTTAGAAALSTLPMATSLVAQVPQGVASGLATAAPFVVQYPLQAYATIYHLISYITGKYEERQLQQQDFVFRRLFNDLHKQTENERMETIFGKKQPVLGWYDYGAILKNTLITFGKTACGQVERAGQMFEITKKLPVKTAELCSRVGVAVQTYLHDTANRMAARPGVGMNPALFSKCADVMKELLDKNEYQELKEDRWVRTCLDRMGILDSEKELTFQKVLLHEATDIAKYGPGGQHEVPQDSLRAEYGSVSPPRSLDDAPGVVPGSIDHLGPHDEYLGSMDRSGELQGTGDGVIQFKNDAAAAAEAAADKKRPGQEPPSMKKSKKGGMKTKCRKSRSTIKRKSNKNKVKSRRYQRRESSRKARK
jgi:hypothetical protein